MSGAAEEGNGSPEVIGEARHLEVPRTARYHLLGPVGAEAGRAPREVWFLLHGYRQLAGRFLRRFAGLADAARLLVAPEALSRFYVEREVGRHGPESLVGASWMTRWDREAEIADYVAYLDLLADRVFSEVDRAGVRHVVLGFSQGVATAARWSVLGSHPPDRLILWGDALPPDLPEEAAAERLGGTRVDLVRGESDRTRRPGEEAAEEERLRRWSVAYRLHHHPEGHRIHPATLDALAEEDAV